MVFFHFSIFFFGGVQEFCSFVFQGAGGLGGFIGGCLEVVGSYGVIQSSERGARGGLCVARLEKVLLQGWRQCRCPGSRPPIRALLRGAIWGRRRREVAFRGRLALCRLPAA